MQHRKKEGHEIEGRILHPAMGPGCAIIAFCLRLHSHSPVRLKQCRGINLGPDDITAAASSSGSTQGQIETVAAVSSGSAATLTDELRANGPALGPCTTAGDGDCAANGRGIGAEEMDDAATSTCAAGEDAAGDTLSIAAVAAIGADRTAIEDVALRGED